MAEEHDALDARRPRRERRVLRGREVVRHEVTRPVEDVHEVHERAYAAHRCVEAAPRLEVADGRLGTAVAQPHRVELAAHERAHGLGARLAQPCQQRAADDSIGAGQEDHGGPRGGAEPTS